jgi:Uma2 family endonuclease
MVIHLDFPHNVKIDGEYIVMKPDVSEEEFWEIANEDTNFELIDGVLLIHSPASTEHEEIFKYLLQIISYYLERTGKGMVIGSRLVMRLSPKWNTEPDLMILLSENTSRLIATRVEGPADMVIEILSPSTRDTDIDKKLPKYLKAGVKEVWILDPANKEITLHDPGARRVMDEKINSKILPGLSITCDWIWNRDEHPASTIIDKIREEMN